MPRFPGAEPFQVTTRPTPLQAKVLELLGWGFGRSAPGNPPLKSLEWQSYQPLALDQGGNFGLKQQYLDLEMDQSNGGVSDEPWSTVVNGGPKKFTGAAAPTIVTVPMWGCSRQDSYTGILGSWRRLGDAIGGIPTDRTAPVPTTKWRVRPCYTEPGSLR